MANEALLIADTVRQSISPGRGGRVSFSAQGYGDGGGQLVPVEGKQLYHVHK